MIAICLYIMIKYVCLLEGGKGKLITGEKNSKVSEEFYVIVAGNSWVLDSFRIFINICFFFFLFFGIVHLLAALRWPPGGSRWSVFCSWSRRRFGSCWSPCNRRWSDAMSHPRDACNGYNSITVLCVSVCVGRCKDCVCIGVCAANPPLAIGQRLIELISETGAGQLAIVAIGCHTPPTGIHPVLRLLILR